MGAPYQKSVSPQPSNGKMTLQYIEIHGSINKNTVDFRPKNYI